MGGEASKFGGIKILLEKYVFCPGEIIKGSINCVIHEAVPSCSLILCFKGQEEVSWYERESKVVHKGSMRSTKIEHRNVHYHNTITISKTRYSIMEWRDSLHPGSYSVPFTFSLPAALPSSFQYLEDSLIFTVVYKVYARLMSPKSKIGDKQEIRIYSHYDVPRPIELIGLDCLENFKMFVLAF